MMIPVIFSDGTSGIVKTEDLEELIRNRKIQSFRRSDGWVRVGLDSVRGTGGHYKGPDRRNEK